MNSSTQNLPTKAPAEKNSVGAEPSQQVNKASSITKIITHTNSANSKLDTLNSQVHVYVDNPPASLLMQPATWFGFFALLISIFSLWKTLQKDKKAIQKSINDDFWIRKVLFELALSPALEFMSKIELSLPKYSERRTAKRYLDDFNRSHRSLAGKLSICSVLDVEFYKETQKYFECFEDAVANYCALLDNKLTDESTLGTCRSQAASEIRELSLKILCSVKSYQQQI